MDGRTLAVCCRSGLMMSLHGSGFPSRFLRGFFVHRGQRPDYHRAVNRHFIAFSGFVGALVIASAALAWWFWPQVALFLDGEQRGGPAYVFDFSLAGGPEVKLSTSSRGTLMRVVRSEGGRFHYHGELSRLLDGEFHEDEWRQIDIYSLDSGSAWLRLATHADYMQLDGGPAARQVLRAELEPAADMGFHGNEVRVIWLLERRADQNFDEIEAFLATTRLHRATPAVRVEVSGLAGQRNWNTVLAFEFPDEAAALGWFRSLKTQTELEIMKSRYVRSAGLLYRDVPM